MRDFDAWEARRVFVFEIEAAGDTGSATGGGIGARALAELACKIFTGLQHCNPRLIVPWARLQSHKRNRLHSLQGLRAKVVELDEYPGAVGSHDDVMFLRDGCV